MEICIQLNDNEGYKVVIENEGVSFPSGFDIEHHKPLTNDNHMDKNPALSLFLCKQIAYYQGGELKVVNVLNGVRV